MEPDRTQEFIDIINALSMKLELAQTAIEALASSLSPDQRRASARCFRERAANVMQSRAGRLTHRDDHAAQQTAAAFLEALGEPPTNV